MHIKILGPGCKNCATLERNVRQALAEMGEDATVEKVTDHAAIMSYGIMSTPGLVIDERVASYGRVPAPRRIAQLIEKAR